MSELAVLKFKDLDLESEHKLFFGKVYVGFALTSKNNNIIAFRGTQTRSEWIKNAHSDLEYYDSSNHKRGKVHKGFRSLYYDDWFGLETSLSKQVCKAAKQFDPSKPCYVTGHSLGGALAVLAATDIALQINGLKDQVQMYNYGGPRIGDYDFASFYNELIPSSYRIVNIVDMVPLLPPEDDKKYLHVGEEWSYLWRTSNIGTNHYLNYLVDERSYNYFPAVEKELEQHNPLTYSAFC